MEMIVNRLSAAVPQLKLCHWWPNGKLPIALNYNAVKYLVSHLRLAAYIHSPKNIRVGTDGECTMHIQ